MKIRKTIPALLVLIGLILTFSQPASAAAAEENILSPWSAEEVQRAESYGLLPLSPLQEDYGALDRACVTDWRQPITRAQFIRFALSYAAAMNRCDEGTFRGLVRSLLAEKSENGYSLIMPFTDDRTEDVALAHALGLAEGRGDGIFDPNAPITRQEAATFLFRVYRACGGTAEEDTAAPFADEAGIAVWATEAVHALRQRDVFRGVGNDRFDPGGSFTVEQCAVTFLRLYEQMPVSRLRGTAIPRFDREETIRGIAGTKDEVLRLEGPMATLLVTDLAAMHATRAYYLIYPEGGARHFAPVVYVWYQDFPMEDPAFSEDGKTLTYTVTLDRELTHLDETTQLAVLDYAPGVYHAVLDVETGAQTFTVTPLPEKARWTDVPEDAWYYEDAVCCADLGLVSEAGKEVFAPDEPITQTQLVETLAHVYSHLSASDTGWSLPLRPENWGRAVVTGEDGAELASFLAWETSAWRFWKGPMNKEPAHYSISAAEDEIRSVFPELEGDGFASCPAVLDMGDKQLTGSLGGYLKSDFEDGRPAFLFYPADSGETGEDGDPDPAAPTMLFRIAKPGGEGQDRGLYYFAEKGIFFLGDTEEDTVAGWEFVDFLYRLSLTGELPEEIYAPINDAALPEGTPYGSYLEPLYRAGILPWEEPNWKFDANAPITRAQFAVTLHRLLEPDDR